VKTFAEPITSVRLYESGAVKTLKSEIRVKESVLGDDKTVVRLSDSGPYRIVMHCQSTGEKRANNSAISKQ
jgi:hypothetical protein